jgi:hypothetical protein
MTTYHYDISNKKLHIKILAKSPTFHFNDFTETKGNNGKTIDNKHFNM